MKLRKVISPNSLPVTVELNENQVNVFREAGYSVEDVVQYPVGTIMWHGEGYFPIVKISDTDWAVIYSEGRVLTVVTDRYLDECWVLGRVVFDDGEGQATLEKG